MPRIFTTGLFKLSPADQCAVVAAHINDLESCLGRYVNPAHEPLAKRQLARFKAKARRLGILDWEMAACEEKPR
jgi:hypothetical protein